MLGDAFDVSFPIDGLTSLNNDRRIGVNGTIKRLFRALIFRLILLTNEKKKTIFFFVSNVKIMNELKEFVKKIGENNE